MTRYRMVERSDGKWEIHQDNGDVHGVAVSGPLAGGHGFFPSENCTPGTYSLEAAFDWLQKLLRLRDELPRT